MSSRNSQQAQCVKTLPALSWLILTPPAALRARNGHPIFRWDSPAQWSATPALSKCVRAAAAKFQRWGGPNSTVSLPHRSGGRKSQFQVLAEAVPGKALSSAWISRPLSLTCRCRLLPTFLHVVFPQCVSVSVSSPPLNVRTPVVLDQGPPWWLHLTWITFKEPHLSIQPHAEVVGVKASVHKLGGDAV